MCINFPLFSVKVWLVKVVIIYVKIIDNFCQTKIEREACFALMECWQSIKYITIYYLIRINTFYLHTKVRINIKTHSTHHSCARVVILFVIYFPSDGPAIYLVVRKHNCVFAYLSPVMAIMIYHEIKCYIWQLIYTIAKKCVLWLGTSCSR